MKKLKILCLVLCLALAVFCCFTACGEEENTECIAHIDENGDKKCDNCGVELNADVPPDPPITDDPTDNGPETECTEHADVDKNHKCDFCLLEISKHSDTDTNHKCDLCGILYSAECISHLDEDKNYECDYCRQEYCAECISHTDDDLDHICDYCKIKINSHSDVNRDRKCDYCYDLFIDACAEHRDADKNHRCDYCLCGFALNCSAPVDVNEDWICDSCGEFYCEKEALLVINDEISSLGAFVEFYQGDSLMLIGDDTGAETQAFMPLVLFLEYLGIEVTEEEDCIVAKLGEKHGIINKSPLEIYDPVNEDTIFLTTYDMLAIGRTVNGVYLVSQEPMQDIAEYFGFDCDFAAAFDIRAVDIHFRCSENHVDGDFDHICDLCHNYCTVECNRHIDSNADNVCDYCNADTCEHKDEDGDIICDVCGTVYVKQPRLYISGNEVDGGKYIQFYNEEYLLNDSDRFEFYEITKVMVPAVAVFKAFGAEITKNNDSVLEFSLGGRAFSFEKGYRLTVTDLNSGEPLMFGEDDVYRLVGNELLVNLQSLRSFMSIYFGEYWEVLISNNMRTVEFVLIVKWT